MKKHYDNISCTYDKNWTFSNEYKEWMTNHIISLLNLNKSDVFVDIGAGTGLYTKILDERISFEKNIIFIEPSIDMSKIAKKHQNFKVFNETSDDFFNRNIHFDKILFKEVIHHIENRDNLWKNLYDNMNNKGIFLIVTRPQNIKIPLFEKVRIKFKQNQPDYIKLVEEVVKVGFKSKIIIDSFNFKVDKVRWYQMIKDRFMSDLNYFTDLELDNGISELENELEGNVINIVDEIIFIIGFKD